MPKTVPMLALNVPHPLEPSHSGQIEMVGHPGRDPSSSPRLRLDPGKPAVSGDWACPLGEGSVMGKCRPPSQVSKFVSASCFWFPCLHLIAPSSQVTLLSGALCAMRRGPMMPSWACGAWLADLCAWEGAWYGDRAQGQAVITVQPRGVPFPLWAQFQMKGLDWKFCFPFLSFFFLEGGKIYV